MPFLGTAVALQFHRQSNIVSKTQIGVILFGASLDNPETMLDVPGSLY